VKTYLVAISIAFASLLCPFQSQATPRYRVVAIKIARPGTIHIRAFNDAGQVIGWYEADNGQDKTLHAFLWERGKTTDMGTLPGDKGSQPMGINAKGQVVGRSFGEDGQEHAFLWERGRMRALHGTARQSSAWAINDRGQIVGSVQTASGRFQNVVWDKDKRTDLGFPHPKWKFLERTVLVGINDSGQMVGEYGDSDTSHKAVLWQNGDWHDLGTDDDAQSEAFAINRQGDIIGQRQFTHGEFHAFLWRHEKTEELTFDPKGVNDRGQVVGQRSGHLFLYENGKTEDLETLMPEHGDGPFRVTAINNRSQILCQDSKGVFVLVPAHAKFGR